MNHHSLSRRHFLKIVALSGLAVGLSTSLTRRLIQNGELQRVEETRGALGTYLRLILITPDRSSVYIAIDAVFDRIAQLEAILSHHRAGSSLGVLNAAGALASPPRELLDVLHTAQQVFEWTGGAFDVTIQPLAQLFTHRQLRGSLPSSGEVRSTLACVGFQHVTLDSRRVTFKGEGMSITLDGIAKGFIVDAALAELTCHGYPHAMVDAGGDIGSARRKGAAWQIGIQDPRRQSGDAIAVAQLNGGALATSGDYLHTFTPDFRVHHILDPRTGLSPLELSSVSIVAPNACLADALSTGVMVLGAQSGLSLVERLPDVECLLVTKTGEVIRSEGFPVEA